MIEDILEFNRQFVQSRQYEKYVTGKYPNKRIAILSCMDARLTELLPAALGFKNGDVKIIKNAGAVISSPFGSVMRSLIIAIYSLGVQDILVIGHYDCGVQNMDSHALLEKMKERGITEESLALIRFLGVDFDSWLRGFEDVRQSVDETVHKITDHPLIPQDVNVYGLVIDPTTGRLDRV